MEYYIISFQNEARKQRMRARFETLGLSPVFTPEVSTADPRILRALDAPSKRVWAVMWQHLDSLRHFLETTASEYVVVCEDDIHIARNFTSYLDPLVKLMGIHQIDCILLGYLLPFKLDMDAAAHQIYFEKISSFKDKTIHKYPDDLWGCQMYLMTRAHARRCVERFDAEYARRNTFSPDWTLTKYGNCALIYPMLAVEEGVNLSDSTDQIEFHKRCFELNYNQNDYL